MDFFVYIHRRASNGKAFYVGKGTRYRHKSKWNRSQHWHNIVNKHGYTIEIVQAGMQEWWAFELERELILKYQAEGLCNRTEGGEGASGCVASDETKQKHRERRWSPEWRQNLSQKAKERFSNPEFKLQYIERQRQVMNRPEVKAKLSAAMIKHFSDPEARNRTRLLSLKQFSDPKAVEIAKAIALARFDSPEKRAKHAQAKAVVCLANNLVFGTTTLAAEWVSSWRGTKADNSQIAKACRGVIPTAYGLRWKYLTPPTEVLGSPRAG
jgi:hypothetical protein